MTRHDPGSAREGPAGTRCPAFRTLVPWSHPRPPRPLQQSHCAGPIGIHDRQAAISQSTILHPRIEMKSDYRLRKGETEGLGHDQIRRRLIEEIWDDFDSDVRSLKRMRKLLTPGQRALLAITWLETEVDNGGFEQFCYNNTGVFADEAYLGFQLLGAADYVKIFDAALALFPDRRIPLAQSARQRAIKAIGRDKLEKAFDHRFYDLNGSNSSSVDHFATTYVEANPEQFYLGESEAEAAALRDRRNLELKLKAIRKRDYRLKENEFNPSAHLCEWFGKRLAEDWKLACKLDDAAKAAVRNALTPGQRIVWNLHFAADDLSNANMYNLALFHGDDLVQIMESLRLIGADERARILESLRSNFGTGLDHPSVKERTNALRRLPTKERAKIEQSHSNAMEQLELTVDQSFRPKLVAYVRANPADFFVDAGITSVAQRHSGGS